MFNLYVWKQESFGDYHEWRISGKGYKNLTSFSWFPLFKPVDSTMQKINPVGRFFWDTR